jgi:hypothetical protein
MLVLEARIKSLVDDRLFQVFWDAVAHFKSKDLVLVFNEDELVDPVTCFDRRSFCNDPEFPEWLLTKLSNPARDVAVELKNSDTSFWFVVMFADGEGGCVAVSAKPLMPGGNA